MFLKTESSPSLSAVGKQPQAEETDLLEWRFGIHKNGPIYSETKCLQQ